AGIELVIPDLARGCALVEEKHHRLHARALKRAAGTVEHSMQIAAFQQQLAQVHRDIVAIRYKCILDEYASALAALEHLDEVLQEQVRGLASADREILLHFLPLTATKGRIRH